MPDREGEGKDSGISAREFLKYDLEKAARFVRDRRMNHGFNMSCLVGVMHLSREEKNALADKVMSANHYDQSDHYELSQRLSALEDSPFRSLSPVEPSPDTELRYFDELVQAGGRPFCSKDEFRRLNSEPEAGPKSLKPWLSGDPHSAAGEMKTLYSRQLRRFFEFRKWRLGNRGDQNHEEEILYFTDANRRLFGSDDPWTRNSSFEDTERRIWQGMRAYSLVQEEAGFENYKKAIESRVAPFRFKRPLRLKRDTRQQTRWETWLEYLCFESQHLEILQKKELSSRHGFHQHWSGLFTEFNTDKIIPAESVRATVEEFITRTMSYVRLQERIDFQNSRVDWVTKEAHALESELSNQGKTSSNKRRRELEVPSDSAPDHGMRANKRQKNSKSLEAPRRECVRRSARLAKMPP